MPPGKRNISEDDPRWDPRTSGNKKYGPGAPLPSNAGGTHKPAKRGTGPGPKGSYSKGKPSWMVNDVSRAAIAKRLTMSNRPKKGS